jgi:hypothetical protein
MAVVHEHVAVAPQGAPAEPVARLGRVSVGFPSQQGIGITAGAVGLVAELDAAEITLVAPPRSASGLGRCPLLALVGLSKTLTQACSRVPSTEKCSSLSSGLIFGVPISFSRTRPKGLRPTSHRFVNTWSWRSRSQFLV